MDVTLTEEQKMLQTMARDFVAKECPATLARAMEEDPRGYPAELWKKMAELSWQGLMFPADLGGAGCGMADQVVLSQEMGRGIVPGPYLATLMGSLAILEGGSDQQKKDFLPKVASGDLVLTLALLEASANYQPQDIQLAARASGQDYILNGTKFLVPSAQVADYMVVVARTASGATPAEGLSLFLVDRKSPGINITPVVTIALDKAAEVAFKDCRVPAKNLLGKAGQGWAPLSRVLQKAALCQCAEIAGMAEKVLEIAVDWAKQRSQYDQLIGSYQLVASKLVDVLRNYQGTRAATFFAAAAIDEGMPATKDVAVAKAYASTSAQVAAYEGHMVFAGQGYMAEHDMHLYSRRLKAAELNLGDARYHQEVLAGVMGL